MNRKRKKGYTAHPQKTEIFTIKLCDVISLDDRKQQKQLNREQEELRQLRGRVSASGTRFGTNNRRWMC